MKDNKPAESYAKPHTMSGKKVSGNVPEVKKDPNTLSASEVTPKTVAMRVSAGNPERQDTKSTGIETRGNGAATKGRIARGPMA